MTNDRELTSRLRHLMLIVGIACLAALVAQPVAMGEAKLAAVQAGIQNDVCVVLGLPEGAKPGSVAELAKENGLLVYFQSSSADEVEAVRKAAQAAGSLGSGVFVDQGDCRSVHLADNLAGAVLIGPSAEGSVDEEEILRVLHPKGKATLGGREIVKPFPKQIDAWSHPYHGPDNNPQSTDQLARAPYLTQFLAEPKFCPMPEISVAAGGKVYRAFGHIAHKENQNAMLNTLICVNAYNGMIVWKRALKEGFMIHRNTMIATPDTLYMADDESCKLIDADTGQVTDEIVIPESIGDGPVWKWMALVDGVLYALIGGQEIDFSTKPSQTPGLGHWPWGMWDGHDYKDPESSFGFGRTFVAIDPKTKKVLWSHAEEEYVDSRGLCMSNGRVYFYSPEKSLGCLDVETREVLWRTSDEELLAAIGPNERAQHYVTGYSTQTYVKCNDRFVFFAGPQRKRLVVVSAQDGKLLWQKEHGNYQLVLRDDGFYAAGPADTGVKLAYETGEVLATLPQRRACTRATGSVDSVFFRTSGGTVRIEADTNTAKHIAPMRPPCQDGVIISDGHLYWGPWMCGCQLSFYGHVCLGPAGDFNRRVGMDDSRLQPGSGDTASVAEFPVDSADWPTYCGNNGRTCLSEAAIPESVSRKWEFQPSSAARPTAPVAAGGLVFVGDETGVVRALDTEGKQKWAAHTSGAVYFPPAVSEGRLFVGSADGRVYAFEAATGRPLWTFRLAPAQRWIPVYGKLISTWPVAGGVVVRDGTVYAAAGIAHYDGTHVVALDGVTGKVKWYNDSSGTLSEAVDSGVSLQGALYIADGELRFLGGGVYETARYNLQTGKCLNELFGGVTSRFHTSFYPYYPDYGKYMSLDHTFADGKSLRYDASYEGSRHTPLALLGPLPPGETEPHKPASRWYRPQGGPKRPTVWQKQAGRFNSVIVSNDILLAAGDPPQGAQPFLAALSVDDGSDIWREQLPAGVVKGGTALDHQGRIIVSLEDGRILCFADSAR